MTYRDLALIAVCTGMLLSVVGCGAKTTALLSGDIEPVREVKPFDTVFPKSNPIAHELVVLREIPRDVHVRIATAALQGLVNRERPMIYLSQDLGLELYQKDGIKVRIVEDYHELFREFKSYYKGAVLYDPNFSPSVNIAITMAGIYDLIPVPVSVQEELGLEVIKDLRNEWATNADAYEWAFDNLWNEVNHHVIAHMRQGYDNDELMINGTLVDYIVEFKMFLFHLDREYTMDEKRVVMDILAAMPVNTPMMGMFGWSDTARENVLVELATAYGKFMVPTYNFNLSVHSGAEVDLSIFKQKTGSALELDENKVYVAFQISDGDSVGVLLGVNPPHGLSLFLCGDPVGRFWWSHGLRGSFPISWQIAPTSIDLAPRLLAYIYETATDNDYFIAAVSGLGYMYPDHYAEAMKNREEIVMSYMSLMDDYLKRLDLAITTTHTNDHGISKQTLKLYTENVPSLIGVFADYGLQTQTASYSQAVYFLKGVENRELPIFHSLVPWYLDDKTNVREKAEAMADYIRDATRNVKGPAFVNAFGQPYTFTPAVLRYVKDILGDRYVIVTADQLVQLANEWNTKQ